MPYSNRKAKIKARPEITTIIFDFGDVLVRDTAKIFENTFDWQKLTPAKQKKYDQAWHSAETGRKSTRYLLKRIRELFGLDMPIARIEKLFTSTKLIKPMWGLFQELRRSYRIAILSNNEREWPAKEAKFAGISLKGIPFFNSARISTQKPHASAYKYALKQLGVKPAEVVFIDDQARNISAARKLGINAIQFTGNSLALRKALKKFGVRVKIK